MTHLLRFLLLAGVVALAGCANLVTPPYGFVSEDREKISPEIGKATLPANAPSISQGYKPDSKRAQKTTGFTQKEISVHEGIDVLDDSGTPVLAAAEGVVESSSFGPLYGHQIVIAHGLSDDGLYYKTKYFHLQNRLVNEGEPVVRGQQIGTLGMTGLLSGGFAHLHFEVRTAQDPDQRLTQAVHPHRYWVDGKGRVTCFDMSRNYSESPFRTTYPVPCAGVRWKEWAGENP